MKECCVKIKYSDVGWKEGEVLTPKDIEDVMLGKKGIYLYAIEVTSLTEKPEKWCECKKPRIISDDICDNCLRFIKPKSPNKNPPKIERLEDMPMMWRNDRILRDKINELIDRYNER